MRRAFLRVLGIHPAPESELVHSEEELRLLLTESHRTGALSASKRKLLENIFDYTRRSAKHIMVPRAEIVFLTLQKSLEENLEMEADIGMHFDGPKEDAKGNVVTGSGPLSPLGTITIELR